MAIISDRDIRTEQQKKVDELHAAPLPFYLTGSRYFHPSSFHILQADWDFYAPKTDAVRSFLASAGFETDHDTYPSDPFGAEVWRHWAGVDVQLVGDVDWKTETQKVIAQWFTGVMGTMRKEDHRVLWTAVAYMVKERGDG